MLAHTPRDLSWLLCTLGRACVTWSGQRAIPPWFGDSEGPYRVAAAAHCISSPNGLWGSALDSTGAELWSLYAQLCMLGQLCLPSPGVPRCSPSQLLGFVWWAKFLHQMHPNPLFTTTPLLSNHKSFLSSYNVITNSDSHPLLCPSGRGFWNFPSQSLAQHPVPGHCVKCPHPQHGRRVLLPCVLVLLLVHQH